MQKNLIITGIPRSGTTLVTALIDSIPNAVALNEPGSQSGSLLQKQKFTPDDFAKWLIGDFIDIRRKILQGIAIPDRRGEDGECVTNYYIRNKGKIENTYNIIGFKRENLTNEFILAVKQIGPYLGILGSLANLDWFNIIAVIRHPVDVITSWRSLAIPPSRGKLPGAVHWQEMQLLTQQEIPLLEKQVKMYDLMCKRLYNLKEKLLILRHENLIQSPLALRQILHLQKDQMYDISLIKAGAKYSDFREHEEIMEAVMKHGNYLYRFYPDIKLGM